MQQGGAKKELALTDGFVTATFVITSLRPFVGLVPGDKSRAKISFSSTSSLRQIAPCLEFLTSRLSFQAAL